MNKLDVETMAEDVDVLLDDVTENLTKALQAWGMIVSRWRTLHDINDATDEDCAFIYQQIQAYIPEVTKATGRGHRVTMQLDNIRRALGLSEGDSPPCEC